MNFENMKIKTRLLIGFSIIGLIVIAMGIVSFFHTQRIWEDTDNLYNHPFKVNIAIREIKTGVTAMHRDIKDVILSENELQLNKYLSDINQEEEKVKVNFDLIYDQFLGSKSSVDSAFAAFEGWREVRDSTTALCRAGKKIEAAYRSTHSAEDYLDMLMSRIDKLQDYAMNKAQAFYSSAEKTKKQLLLQLWLILISIFIVTLGVAYAILKSITVPLKVLQEATIEQRKGNYEARCLIESTNEMGQLATSFNLMANSIQSEINVKNSITRISYSMLGQDDLSHFARALLGVIMENAQANMGAIYFLNEATSVFEPGFSVGLRADKIGSFSEHHFEGEFGMVLLEKKMVHIRQIPDDTLFDFSAVTGHYKPKEILIVPVLLNDKIISIISLATLGSFSLETLETMRISDKNITAGLSSILAFQKIRDYSRKLDNQNTELEQQSKELKYQTDELHEQNAELEIQKRQIDEASQLKSEFLSSMSHELRTPLNSVIALSSVLSKKLKNRIPDDEYSYLEIIERNGKNLLTLINEILDLSRIESGKTEILFSSFSLQEATESILETLQIPITEKNLKIIINLDKEFPIVYTDRSKCYHILQNLIGNAVKFTDKGSIEISAGISGSQVRIMVKDTGIGISPEHIGHIFEQFHQVDGTSSKKHEGTGLGLAIADKYSRLLDGRIEVTSEPGIGSVFTLVLPLIHSALRNGNTAEVQDYRSERPLEDLHDQTTGNPTDKLILIIEDSEPAIIQLSDILSEEGYNLKIARSGLEALELVKSVIPDAIILDLMMPGMDGFEVLEKIRGTVATVKIPVLILTAKYLNKNELYRLTANNIHQLVQKGDVGKEELMGHIRKMTMYTGKQVFKLPKKAVPVTKEGKPTVLLVEDNADNVKTVEVLMAGRFDLIVANDGAEGIERAQTSNPDLILLDISLPVKDGFMVLEEIRKCDWLDKVPVIAVTARAMKGDKDHFLNYGFDDYISKPIDSQIFQNILTKWVPGITGF